MKRLLQYALGFIFVVPLVMANPPSSLSCSLEEKQEDRWSKATILIEGEVLKPGHYPIQKGARLSEILVQAGGFLPFAYPYGAIFKRHLKNNRMERLSIEADFVVLQLHPERDTYLEPGDHLIIPRRPNQVKVRGAVFSPGYFQFQSGLKPEDYIQMAGGYLPQARQNEVRILLPDGKTQQLYLNAWHYEQALIPPGAEIIVP